MQQATKGLTAIKCIRAEQQEGAGVKDQDTIYSLQQWKVFSHPQLVGELRLHQGI